MPIRQLTDNDKLGFKDKLIQALEPMVDDAGTVDVVTFCESPEYLGQTLFPRQRLILKLWYKLELSSYPCYCAQKHGAQAPEPECPYCGGTGTYNELEDTRYLLSRQNHYAQLFFPGIAPKEAYTLSDDELRARLRGHYAHVFEAIGGRGSGKSVDGAFCAAYELYGLLRLPNPFHVPGQWKLVKGDPISVVNVATNEEQAKIMYAKLIALVDESPWFKRRQYRALDRELEFVGRALSAKSFHSNSSAVRGFTAKYAFLDEFAHFNSEGGKLSDGAMMGALEPATSRFGEWAKLFIGTTPLNMAGVTWDYYDKAKKGQNPYVIVLQVATWEMHPDRTREDQSIQNAYLMDAPRAEMEYGAQFANQVGNFIPREAVDKMFNGLGIETFGTPGLKYVCHVDLSKKHDKTVLGVGYYDAELKKVRLVHAKFFDLPEHFNEFKEVRMEAVEEYILQLWEDGFRFVSITFDQFNSLSVIQRLRAALPKSVIVDTFDFTEKSNMEIFSNLRTLITGRGMEMYESDETTEIGRQIKNLTRTFKRNGKFKVEAPLGDADDGADVAAAVALKALHAFRGLLGGVVDAGYTGKEGRALDGEEDVPEGLEHLPECDLSFCEAGCPVQDYYFLQATTHKR
jgi:hypothetical protein